MTINLLMPALSPTMEEGKLAKWLKKEGDTVDMGEAVAEIETDKATMEFEAADEGTLGKILVPEGTDNVKVNQPIAILLEEGEDDSALEEAAKQAQAGGGEEASGKTEQKEEKKEKKEKKAEPEPAEEAGDEESAPAPKRSTVEVREAAEGHPEEQDEPDYGKTVNQTVREAVRDALAEEMRRDGDVFLMGEEIGQYEGAYKCTQGLLKEFGDKRVVDTPITEYGFAGVAVGAGYAGLKPVLEFMTFNFAMQAIDHIVNSAAKTLYMAGGQMGCPIVFRGPNGPAPRTGAQHSQCYASWYAHVPGLKVVSPWSGADHKGLLKAAIRDPNPVMVLENENLYGLSFDVPESDDFVLPIGKAKVERKGSDVTLVSFSTTMIPTLEAAEKLAEQGIEAEVINLRTLRPLDTETLVRSVKKTNRIVTVEQGWAYAGIGSEIASVMMERAFDYLDAPVMRVSGADVPMPYAANLEKLALVQADDVVEAAKGVCYVD